MRSGWVLATLLLVATAAAGAVQLRETVTVSPSALAPPVTLLAGPSGSTSLGSSATSASTTANIVLSTLSVLKVHKVSGNWDVKVSLVSATGFGVLESATVALVGSTTQTQVVVTLGSVTQSSGATVALTGADLTITAAGTLAVSGGLNLRVALSPQGSTEPVLEYAYTLTLG